MTTEPDGDEGAEETIEDLEAPATAGDNVVGGELPHEPTCKTSSCSPSCLGSSCNATDAFCFGTTRTHDMVVWEK
jgi:hypothetical protein